MIRPLTEQHDRLKSSEACYLLAIALTLTAFLVRGPLLGGLLGRDAPLMIFILAVTVASIYGGLGPGLLATLLSLSIGIWFFIERDGLIIVKLSDRVRIGVFFVEGVLIGWLGHARRAAHRRIQANRETLKGEVELRRAAEAELAVMNQRKDEFLMAFAHELRSPLAAVHYALELLRVADNDRDSVHDACTLMRGQVQQIKRLIDDLVDLSRIEKGKVELRKEWVDVTTAVQMAVDANRPLIEKCEHEFTVALPAEPLRLNVDPARLVQILSNLLSNAAKYTEKSGHICLAAGQQGNDVLISVRDDGIGIAKEMLPKVFDMFMQVEGGSKQTQTGLGIGLSLVQRLAELHGGEVQARSAGLGLGSEFIVRIPVAVPLTGREDQESVHQASGGSQMSG